MNKMMKIAVAAAVMAAVPAFAQKGACGNDAATQGLKARIANLNAQMDKIQWSTDREEQRHLLELHTKLMHEGLQQLKIRKTTPACRLEMTQAMLDQMIQNQLAEQEFSDHR